MMKELFHSYHTDYFSIRYENDGNGAIVTIGESITLESILSLHKHVYHPERLTRLGYAIFDMRNTRRVDVKPAEMEIVAQSDALAHQSNPHFVVAIIPCAEFTLLQQNIFELFSVAYSDTLRKQFFADFSIAHQWAVECWQQEQCTQLHLATLNSMLSA